MKNRIGLIIMVIGIIHTLVGLYFLGDIGLALLQEGFFNTINGEPLREAFFWFLFSGFTMIILGMMVRWYEKRGILLPAFLGWSLLFLALLVIVVMPVSGGWLMLLPAAMLIKKYTPAAA